MTICVVGLGYIGLPTSLVLAANGYKVVGMDIKQELVEALNSGEAAFNEVGLGQIYSIAKNLGNIEFSTEYFPTDTYIITVPTPYVQLTKRIDAGFVVSAVRSVLSVCSANTIIIIESTIPPGTIDNSIRPLVKNAGLRDGVDVHLVHAPERIVPGNLLNELISNARTIGADSPEIGQKVKKIYESFCKNEIMLTDIKTAEMTKIVENAFRDINIAYANELTKICRFSGLDVHEIIRIANKHPRVNILDPGPGVGGHCIPVDPWFLVSDYPTLTNLVHAARDVNDSMPEYVLDRTVDILSLHNINNFDRVGIYGLTYKEDVDDVRNSPTFQLLNSMYRHLANPIKVYDPYIERQLVPNQYFNLDDFLADIDMIIIMAAHKEIIENRVKLARHIVFDTRNACQIKHAYKL
jgi:UDP-N-acetyl-D-mannosaminuronic acid dehydrogenase